MRKSKDKTVIVLANREEFPYLASLDRMKAVLHRATRVFIPEMIRQGAAVAENRMNFKGDIMRITHTLCAISAAVALAGCQDGTTATSPDRSLSSSRGSAPTREAEVRIEDACDPATFSVIPGGCHRSGGMKLDQFNAVLAKLGTVPAWHFAPTDLYIHEGDSFVAENYGGEMHTFTEVEEFGGGIVPALNEASGNTTVAPECETLGQASFLAPGQETPPDTPEEVGDEHYQCCIHPWMRMTVHVVAR